MVAAVQAKGVVPCGMILPTVVCDTAHQVKRVVVLLYVFFFVLLELFVSLVNRVLISLLSWVCTGVRIRK